MYCVSTSYIMEFTKAYLVTFFTYEPWSNKKHAEYFFNREDAERLLQIHKDLAKPSWEPTLDEVLLIKIDNQYYSIGSVISISSEQR